MENQSKSLVSDYIKNYKNAPSEENVVNLSSLPKQQKFSETEYEKILSKETDPDLTTIYEIVLLPSKGMFYGNGLKEVNVEYMTSKDEDLLTTPSLIDSGNLLDLLLKRKIKTPNVNVEDLLPGDKNAIILFLRTSSYGKDYTVQVADPRTGLPFTTKVDLSKLKHKELQELPDNKGHFTVEIPMRKKIVKFRLLTSGEEKIILKKAEAIKEAYGEEFSQYSTLRLKASIVAINEKTDRVYIDKFVDAMPALDAYTIRKKILEVSPDVDMNYEFTTKDGYSFNRTLLPGDDFFFPNT